MAVVAHVLWCVCSQVDIFSLGVILYELCSMVLVASRVHQTGEPDEFEQYAHRVAGGYRQPLKPSWPPPVKARASERTQAQDPVQARLALSWATPGAGSVRVSARACFEGACMLRASCQLLSRSFPRNSCSPTIASTCRRRSPFNPASCLALVLAPAHRSGHG